MHLKVHTEYSLSDSVVRVPELVAAVAAAGMPAVAVADQSNLFAMVKFYKEALKAGVKPLVGVDLMVREEGERAAPSRITFLCQTPEGYRNLARLVSRAYLDARERGTPRLERAWLTAQSVAGPDRPVRGDRGRHRPRAAQRPRRRGRARARGLARAVPGALLPGAAAPRPAVRGRLHRPGGRAGRAARRCRWSPPTTCASSRPTSSTRTRRACASTTGRCWRTRAGVRRYSRQQYLRTRQEMAALFADIPEALANSVEIARRCSLTLKLGQARLPQYPVPEGLTTEEFLRTEAAAGLAARFVTRAQPIPRGTSERLASELDVICQMGFAGYFLIVADFIRWARGNGVPVGPGRGSGAGSLVAYSLGITDLDPIKYDLLFERFLNPERVSMPDFDIDFCMDGRDRVIEYVAQKYGRERVSQIITYGTMAAKAVVRDVGRVLGMTYGYVDRIAKLIPFELGITLDAALEKEPELAKLYQAEDEVKNLIDLARSLEGLTRNAGMHAGGVVIAPSVLTDFTPLYCDSSGGGVITQFDKDDVEAAGLVKFDFLGLRTLTIIDRAEALINRERAAGTPALNVSTLPMDDAATYALLKSCRTTAVFQLESRGMKDLIRRLQPDSFEDIVALVALFRPGPLQSGMVDDFINRKHGRCDGPIDYLHPALEPIMKPTYGVILYQEQVMQIAQVLAGYTLGGADLLRRAMGKKNAEDMAAAALDLRLRRGGARGERGAGRAHLRPDGEVRRLRLQQVALGRLRAAVLPDRVPEGALPGRVHGGGAVGGHGAHRQGGDAHPGVHRHGPRRAAPGRERLALRLRRQRRARHPLRPGRGARGRGGGGGGADPRARGRRRLHLARGPVPAAGPAKANRRTLEALLRSGSLDGLGANRATLMDRLSAAMQLGDQNTRTHQAGQNDMFGLTTDAQQNLPPARAAALPEWSEAVRLTGERETLGLYLTGHPLARFEASLKRFVSHRIGDLVSDKPAAGFEAPRFGGGKPVTVAGLIDEVKKRGPRVILTLDDRTGRIEAMLFEDTFQKYRDLIAKDALVLVDGSLRFDEFSDAWRLSVKKLTELDKVREQEARRLVIRCSHAEVPALSERLAEVLAPWRPGPCPITIEYSGVAASGALTLDGQWSVRASRELLEQIEGLVGRDGVQVLYGAPAATPGASFADGR